MHFQFENPMALWGLIPVFGLVALMIWRGICVKGTLSVRRIVLAFVGFGLCVLGMARPQLGSRVSVSLGMRTNLVLAIDISKSMLAQDISPSRLGFAIVFAQKLLQQTKGIKVAIFPFAADGYMQIPFTTDLIAASDMLTPLSPTMTTNQGTDFTPVLTSLFTSLARMESNAREKGEDWMPTQIVLLSDGETHQRMKGSILKEFQSRRIPIHAVAVGTTSGSQVMVDGRLGLGREMLRDQDGKSVITKLYPDVLKEIASATSGDYFAPRFEEVFRLRDRLERAAQMGKLNTSFKMEKEYFPLLFALALLVFCVEFSFGRWEYAIRTLLIWCVFSTSHATSEPVEETESLDPKIRAIDAYNLGVKQAESNPQKAAELFQESASSTEDPDLKKKALFNLGNALLKLADPVQAINAYQSAHDAKALDATLDTEANHRISENIVLAARILERMKQQAQSGEGKSDSDPSDSGKQGQDRKGPQKQYDAQNFSEQEKQKIFDLMSQEEQQTMSRLQEQRNRHKPRKATDKTW